MTKLAKSQRPSRFCKVPIPESSHLFYDDLIRGERSTSKKRFVFNRGDCPRRSVMFFARLTSTALHFYLFSLHFINCCVYAVLCVLFVDKKINLFIQRVSLHFFTLFYLTQPSFCMQQWSFIIDF